MELVDVWPLFGLRLRSPRLELRLVRDDDLPGLIESVLAGVHDRDRMPFSTPWTDAPPERLVPEFARFQWTQRAAVTPESWKISFVVLEGGIPIGVQELGATELAITKTVSSGSWLTASRQGAGLGTEMRAALLIFAFDHLGAERAESSAASWNRASLRVSEKLGYRENGTGRVAVRGEPVEHIGLRVHRDGFRRPGWQLEGSGVDAALAQLGLRPRPAPGA